MSLEQPSPFVTGAARLAALASTLVVCSTLRAAAPASTAPSPPPAAAQPDSATAEPASTQPAGPRDDLPGLSNFARVSPTLYRGAQPTAEGFRQLKKLGVRTVVNLRAFHSDRELLKGTGLTYVHIPCHAWHPEREDVIAFLKVLSDPANQPVFVHCAQGSDRTGLMVAVYRMVEQRWPRDQAIAELPRFGFHPIWDDITDYLEHLDPGKLAQAVPGHDVTTAPASH